MGGINRLFCLVTNSERPRSLRESFICFIKSKGVDTCLTLNYEVNFKHIIIKRHKMHDIFIVTMPLPSRVSIYKLKGIVFSLSLDT